MHLILVYRDFVVLSTTCLSSVGGGIPFCNVSEGGVSEADNCATCYATLNLMEPLRFQERIRGEALEKVEEAAQAGGHFEENCLEHRLCLTDKQSEGVF